MTQAERSLLLQGLDAAKSRGAGSAKIRLSKEKKTTCRVEAGRLKETGQSERLSYSIEVLTDGRRASTCGNRLDALDTMAERAVDLARIGSVAHFDAYPSPSPATSVRTHSEGTSALSRERMIDACIQMADAIRAYDCDLWTRCEAERVESEAFLVTTGGVCHSTKRTQWRLGGYVRRAEGLDVVTVYSDRRWCDLNALYDAMAVAEDIIVELRRSTRMADAPSGPTRAYLTPRVLAWMLEPILLGTDGRSVARGLSPLAGRLGEQGLANTLSICDDPHQDYAPGAREVDDDGVPTRKQAIFENGVLSRFLYDLDSAGLAGAEPTGNRDCRPYWPMVLPGDRSSPELLADIEDGVYISNLLGFGRGNPISGDFSCGVALGYRVRHGEIVGRVKDTMVSGNVYELFGRDVQLSSGLNYEARYPHAVVDGINVSC